jgi:hypothetical protein
LGHEEITMSETRFGTTNAMRAGWAEDATRHFGRMTAMDTAGEDLHTMAGDLLTNLIHLAAREDWDFGEMLWDAIVLAEEETEAEKSY